MCQRLEFREHRVERVDEPAYFIVPRRPNPHAEVASAGHHSRGAVQFQDRVRDHALEHRSGEQCHAECTDQDAQKYRSVMPQLRAKFRRGCLDVHRTDRLTKRDIRLDLNVGMCAGGAPSRKLRAVLLRD